MIALYVKDETISLPCDWAGTYIASRIAAYGTQAKFAPVYVDEQGSVASVLDGNMILCGENANAEEWAAFISFQPTVQSLIAEISLAQRIADILQKPMKNKKVMRLEKPLSVYATDVVSPTPREIYPLLSSVFGEEMPPFDSWYVDISHRMRHDLCKAAGVMCEGEVVSTAMTVAESAEAAVIGAVATAPNHRKKGYAGQCIARLVTLASDKTIMIAPKNTAAELLYTNMGFSICGEIGLLDLQY